MTGTILAVRAQNITDTYINKDQVIRNIGSKPIGWFVLHLHVYMQVSVLYISLFYISLLIRQILYFLKLLPLHKKVEVFSFLAYFAFLSDQYLKLLILMEVGFPFFLLFSDIPIIETIQGGCLTSWGIYSVPSLYTKHFSVWISSFFFQI